MTGQPHASSAERRPRVVIIGAGAGGIVAAKILSKAPVEVVLLDRVNHYVMQALLYEVAGSQLDAGNIAFPVRAEFRKRPNVRVALAEVVGIDVAARHIHLAHTNRTIRYDYLILATGLTVSYFGHDDWAEFAPGLKTLRDAQRMRSHILRSFERAEAERDPVARARMATFVLVGAGPTGCEMAGTLAEMVHLTLKPEFRRFDPETSRIVLVEAGPRVLPMFSEELSAKAKEHLEKMGVEVLVGRPVECIDAHGVIVAGERIASDNVIWTAGVKATPIGEWLGAKTDRSGKVLVEGDLTVPGHPEVFVVGDVAHIEQNGQVLPAVAQVAMQSARYAAREIARREASRPPAPPFSYFDKGMLATIGRDYAILESHDLKVTGLFAKLIWAVIHVWYLIPNDSKLVVFIKGIYHYVTKRRGTRLIIE